jgi:hypothetical protein
MSNIKNFNGVYRSLIESCSTPRLKYRLEIVTAVSNNESASKYCEEVEIETGHYFELTDITGDKVSQYAFSSEVERAIAKLEAKAKSSSHASATLSG